MLTLTRPNDQKLFYNLLLKHRDAQLENYVPDIGYSTSDYHHARPLAQIRKLSTRQFVQPNPKGHRRGISRFTVVSNVSRGRESNAETEAAETVQSYDPFRASRSQNLVNAEEAGQANVVVYRGRPIVQEVQATSRSSRRSATSSGSRSRQQNFVPPRAFTSRSSLASSTLSRGSARGVRVPTAYKRGVSFSHIRRPSETSQLKIAHKAALSSELLRQQSDIIGRGSSFNTNIASPLAPQSYVRSRKGTVSTSQPLLTARKPDRVSRLWNEDVRQLSSSLAQTCDEAFNRTSVASTIPTKVSCTEDSHSKAYDSPISSFEQTELRYEPWLVDSLQSSFFNTHLKGDHASLETRPLPPPPTRSESVSEELAEARRNVQLRRISGDDSPGHLDRMVSHIDQLLQPVASPPFLNGERRTASAPVNYRIQDPRIHLPSIHESQKEEAHSDHSSEFEDFMQRERVKVAQSNRNASAPERYYPRRNPTYNVDHRNLRVDTHVGGGIRMIEPSSPSPAKPPAPLNIRKISSQGAPSINAPSSRTSPNQLPPGFELRQLVGFAGSSSGSRNGAPQNQFGMVDATQRSDGPFAGTNTNSVSKKKSSWFKRNSKTGEAETAGYSMDRPESRTAAHDTNRHANADNHVNSTKRKSFGFGRLFGKRNSKQENSLETPGKCFPVVCILPRC